MVSALGGGESKADCGKDACALAPTVTYANGIPRIAVKSCAILAVMTTCTQENFFVPMQACGIGEPGRLIGGLLRVTLLLKPVVALHAGPTTSNHVALKAVPEDTSQPFV